MAATRMLVDLEYPGADERAPVTVEISEADPIDALRTVTLHGERLGMIGPTAFARLRRGSTVVVTTERDPVWMHPTNPTGWQSVPA